jgi:hypothetical protein
LGVGDRIVEFTKTFEGIRSTVERFLITGRVLECCRKNMSSSGDKGRGMWLTSCGIFDRLVELIQVNVALRTIAVTFGQIDFDWLSEGKVRQQGQCVGVPIDGLLESALFEG